MPSMHATELCMQIQGNLISPIIYTSEEHLNSQSIKARLWKMLEWLLWNSNWGLWSAWGITAPEFSCIDWGKLPKFCGRSNEPSAEL